MGQLAKHEGLTVIGSVGSDEKLEFIKKDLNFDEGFNYKKENPADALARLAPNGINIYYDNVGGEQLDAALATLTDYGRITMWSSVRRTAQSANRNGSRLWYDLAIQYSLSRPKVWSEEFDANDTEAPQYARIHGLRSRYGSQVCCRTSEECRQVDSRWYIQSAAKHYNWN